MKIITIKSYEMCSRSRWGWHTFRDGKNYDGKIIGFRFFGIGLCWRKSSNDSSSATRRTGRNDCNRDAPAGFAAAHG